MKQKATLTALAVMLCSGWSLSAQDFKLTSSGYFNNQGVDVMAFDDIYPEGHQGGVSLLMNGHRIATNGVSFVPSELIRWKIIYLASAEEAPEIIFKVTERIDISNCSK